MTREYVEKKSKLFALGLSALLGSGLVLLFALPVLAEDIFMMNADGTVQAGENTYSSFEEYTQSDYFREKGKRCGTKEPEKAVDEELAKSVNDCTFSLTNIQNEYWPGTAYVAKIWFHVIYMSNGTGNISDAAIQAQIDVLNEDYRATAGTMGSQGFDTRIEFQLAGITRTQNDAWFTDSTADEDAYKQALNKDPSKFINIYTNDAGGYLGYAYFPQGGSAGQYYDGIVLNYQAVGGRNNGFSTYDQGRTLVHEMGHYMGLFHTFQDGSTCINSYTGGDLIVDTPPESVEHYGCTQTNTCNSPDPIHNYMDYTDDICMYQFTQEQGNRAVCGLVNYRPGIFTTNVPPPTPGGALSLVAPIIKPLLLQPSCEAATAVLSQDFESNPILSGWSIINNGGNCTWASNTYYGASNKTGGSGLSAAADSDVCGLGSTMDTELRTPPLDLSAASCATLTYKTFYEDLSGDADGAYVDISTDGGSSWTNILQWVEEDHDAAETVTLDLTPYVGSANTVVRFHYVAPGWDWDWQVDEVVITTD